MLFKNCPDFWIFRCWFCQQYRFFIYQRGNKTHGRRQRINRPGTKWDDLWNRGDRANRYISTAYTTSVQFHRCAIYQQLYQILEISNNNKGKQKILESRHKLHNQQCEVSLRLGEETQQKRGPNLSSFSDMQLLGLNCVPLPKIHMF